MPRPRKNDPTSLINPIILDFAHRLAAVVDRFTVGRIEAAVRASCNALPGPRPRAAQLPHRRLDGPRPPQLMLRCRATGLKPPVKYAWRFAPSVRQVGWQVPVDEAAMLVTIPDPPTLPVWAECTATGEDKVEVRA